MLPPHRPRGNVHGILAAMERFSGWIAGVGTGRGHRLVIGHWHASPFGQVTDAMVEDPAGRRSLYAPTPELAEFLAGIYRFDEVQVGSCSARRAGSCWEVQAGPLQLSFTIGRRSLLGWLLWAIPAPLARARWWVSLLDQVARRLLPGVRTRGGTRNGRRQWYGARDLHRIVAARATLRGRDLGALGPVRPPVGFGFGSVPDQPSLVHLTSIIESPAGGR